MLKDSFEEQKEEAFSRMEEARHGAGMSIEHAIGANVKIKMPSDRILRELVERMNEVLSKIMDPKKDPHVVGEQLKSGLYLDQILFMGFFDSFGIRPKKETIEWEWDIPEEAIYSIVSMVAGKRKGFPDEAGGPPDRARGIPEGGLHNI